MHALITGFPETDHVNGNSLDNRRVNLREATRSQNNWNRGKQLGSSRFKGITWDKRDKNWKAQIQVNYKRISIGRFTDEIEAAKAYDKAAMEHFGEFARTNVMLGLLKEEK